MDNNNVNVREEWRMATPPTWVSSFRMRLSASSSIKSCAELITDHSANQCCPMTSWPVDDVVRDLPTRVRPSDMLK